MIYGMYRVQRPSRSEFVPIRHLRYHVRQWGTPSPDQAPLIMVHGWMDVAASFQFVVDAMAQDRWVIAPDWRGFGLTEVAEGTDHFWFPDYLADLDQLLNHFVGERPVDLVGHSMGGHIATLYAGVRPERIRKLINLEGFGLPATRPSQAPTRYAQWMDQIQAVPTGAMDLKSYDSLEGVVQRLIKTNPRLSADKAQWLAQHWSRQEADGRWRVLGHPAHKIVNAQLFRVDEVLAVYQRITAPTLCVVAETNEMGRWWQDSYDLAEFMQRIAVVPQVEHVTVHEAGHMLHHDQPKILAQHLESFFNR
jgi:pimeloyl-ACP methyl ester carboxylesterase